MFKTGYITSPSNSVFISFEGDNQLLSALTLQTHEQINAFGFTGSVIGQVMNVSSEIAETADTMDATSRQIAPKE